MSGFLLLRGYHELYTCFRNIDVSFTRGRVVGRCGRIRCRTLGELGGCIEEIDS
jgi:hypothetical protein